MSVAERYDGKVTMRIERSEEPNPFNKEHYENVQVSFGKEISFNMLGDAANIDTWAHEFAEDALGYVLSRDHGIDESTIAQIIGHAHGLTFNFKGEKLFGTISHMCTTLAGFDSWIPVQNGFKLIDGENLWLCIKDACKCRTTEARS